MTSPVSADEELPLDERIALLTRLRAAPPVDADVAELTGLLGGAWLERYELDRDEAALEAGLSHLCEAVEAAPEHPDRAQWYHALGVGYGERAAVHGDVGDYDVAIEWLTMLYDGLPASDPDRDYAAVTLMELHWDRFGELRYGRECSKASAREQAEQLVSGIGALAVSDTDPEAAAYARMLVGLSRLERYEISEQRIDLDLGIGAISGALPAVPPDAPRRGLAAAELTNAYQVRAALDSDPDSLDLSIAAGEEAIRAGDTDRPEWVLLHHYQALGYRERWWAADDPHDLDRAIACWRVALGEEADAWAGGRCGALLCQRAELTGESADVDEAIRLLEQTIEALPDEPDVWQCRYELGQAYQARWRLTGTPHSLDEAGRCLDRAVQLGVPDDDGLLLVHYARLSAAHLALERDGGQPYTEPPASAVRLRRLIHEARDAFDRAITAEPDRRAMLAAVVGFAEIWVTGHDLGTFDANRVRGLLALGAQVREQPPGWQALLDYGNGLLQYASAAQRPAGGTDRGMADLLRAAASQHLDESNRDALRLTLPMVLQSRAAGSGDLRGSRASARLMRQAASARRARSGTSEQDAVAELFAMVFAAFDRAQSGDLDSFHTMAEQAAEMFDRMPTSLMTEMTVKPMVRFMQQMSAMYSGRAFEPDVPTPGPTGLSGIGSGLELFGLLLQTTGRLAGAAFRNDLTALRECAQQVELLANRAPVGHVLRLFAGTIAGRAYLEVARRDRTSREAARRAAHWFSETVALARGPEHPLWAQFALGWAESSRLAGDPDRARTRELGMSALQGHAWQVLLQAGTDYAIEAARAASADALTVAGWCLDDGTYDELIAVLDAGRGLVLHAATVSRGIADELADNGYRDLAEEWRATAGLGRDEVTGGLLSGVADSQEVPDDLRARVLRALHTDRSAAQRIGPLEPVRVDEVQAGLSVIGADALVYLVPATASRPGTAVVVPVAGVVDTIRLPDLVVGPGSPISRYTEASGAARDAGPVGSDGPRPAGVSLDDLCRWAWMAATRDLVDYVQRWHLHRAARLVVVPMGMLALVPWHAAYDPFAADRRYAVQDLVFSYSVSARMLCTSARKPIQAIRSSLVVGNPGGDLTFAGIEARAVHKRFYPAGTYFGRPTTEAGVAGTVDQVLGWIAAAGTGPSLLHFACHGRTDPAHPADAQLVLADGGTLTARELLEASRLAALVIDRVFLAACTTSVTGQDYDEAFSMSTAFLAAGAHTVFGSLWPVPDADTSLLMFMIHHYLNVEACAPAEALHRAQVWMLDPKRQPPAGMPAELVGFCARPEATGPVSWAGFTHLGR